MKGFYSLINIPKVEKGAKREGRDLHRSACSGRDVNAHRRTEQISYSVFVPVDELCRCDDKKLHGRVGQAIEVHRAGLLAVHLSHSDARSILLLGPLAGLHQAGSQVDHATPYHGVKIRGAGTQRNRKGEGGGTRSRPRPVFRKAHLAYTRGNTGGHQHPHPHLQSPTLFSSKAHQGYVAPAPRRARYGRRALQFFVMAHYHKSINW